MSTISLEEQKQQQQPVPRSIAGSLHKKQDFHKQKPKPLAESMMYSKSNLLKMIFENDTPASGQTITQTADETNIGSLSFALKRKLRKASNSGAPLQGSLNLSPSSKRAIFARDFSRNSIQFVTEASKSQLNESFLNQTIDVNKGRNNRHNKRHVTLDRTSELSKMSQYKTKSAMRRSKMSDKSLKSKENSQQKKSAARDAAETTIYESPEVKRNLELAASPSSVRNHEYSVVVDQTPWTEENTQGISFEEFRARIEASHNLQKAIEEEEKNFVSDLNLAAASEAKQKSKKEKSKKREMFPQKNLNEEEKDKIRFEELVKAGTVNIRSLVLKQIHDRTAKENEFLTLYLKN